MRMHILVKSYLCFIGERRRLIQKNLKLNLNLNLSCQFLFLKRRVA